MPRQMVKPSQAKRFRTLRTIFALIMREMGTTYGRSPGGYLWAILEPAAGIALLTVIFSVVGFRTPPIGTNFAIFYATGLLPFTAYMGISGKLAQALLFSKSLLAYPRVTFMDAILARFLLNFSTQLMTSYVLFALILLFYETRTSLDFNKLALAFAMVGALGFGVGVMNCYLTTRFQVWAQIWAIGNRPMFIISGIFFIFDTVPEPYRSYLWYNPLIHIIGMTRAAFYPYYDADYVSMSFVFAISIALSSLGLILLKRYHKDILYR